MEVSIDNSKKEGLREEEVKIDNLKKIEAILFISGRFLEIEEISMLSNLDPKTVKTCLINLRSRYNQNNSAIEIIEKNDLWKMDVGPTYSYIINKLAGGKSEFTKAEQETLAIIVFKQPIKQSVVVKIRGNKAYNHIKKFSDLGLVKKKKVGRSWELSVSNEFYNYFNISQIVGGA
ncbi:MAG: SMC-Scp complex subunit ScpB [Candidatus Pacearchaeota archaeon]